MRDAAERRKRDARRGRRGNRAACDTPAAYPSVYRGKSRAEGKGLRAGCFTPTWRRSLEHPRASTWDRIPFWVCLQLTSGRRARCLNKCAKPWWTYSRPMDTWIQSRLSGTCPPWKASFAGRKSAGENPRSDEFVVSYDFMQTPSQAWRSRRRLNEHNR